MISFVPLKWFILSDRSMDIVHVLIIRMVLVERGRWSIEKFVCFMSTNIGTRLYICRTYLVYSIANNICLYTYITYLKDKLVGTLRLILKINYLFSKYISYQSYYFLLVYFNFRTTNYLSLQWRDLLNFHVFPFSRNSSEFWHRFWRTLEATWSTS